MPYLKLWHGHRHPDEQLDGWGEDGPTFGPFPFFHMTYGCDIKFGEDGCCLNLVEEFVYYDGMYYGDWSVTDGACVRESKEYRRRIKQVEAWRARLPAKRGAARKKEFRGRKTRRNRRGTRTRGTSRTP